MSSTLTKRVRKFTNRVILKPIAMINSVEQFVLRVASIKIDLELAVLSEILMLTAMNCV